MKKFLHPIFLLFFCIGLAEAQSGHTIQVDDGFGHYFLLGAPVIGGPPSTTTITLPSTGGTLLTASIGGVSPSWLVTGNSGTTPGTNFAGTIDNVAFHLNVRSGSKINNSFILGNTGSLSREITPGGGVVAGNARGGEAIDLQETRSLATQVASGNTSVISGGYGNTASALLSTVGGGQFNKANGVMSIVGGGNTNTAIGQASTISGGNFNVTGNDFANVGGGQFNDAANIFSTVSGGYADSANGQYSIVGGGYHNNAKGDSSFIGGGSRNLVSGMSSVISGGYADTITGIYSTIGGGINNSITTTFGNESTIGGGLRNSISGFDAVIAGGSSNSVVSGHGAILGGSGNYADQYATVGGGGNDTARGWYSSIVGGFANKTNGFYSLVAGGLRNTTNSDSSFIGGGSRNTVSGIDAIIVGGYNNTVSGTGSFIGGGGYDGTTAITNNVTTNASSIVGGVGNQILAGNGSFIGGGFGNLVFGKEAFIGGGEKHVATGAYSAIAGGFNNQAQGDYSCVPGGHSMLLSAANSFGFNADNATDKFQMSIANTFSNIAVFANCDMWLANTNNKASVLRFYEAQAAFPTLPIAFPNAVTNYVGITAPTLSADYTLTLPVNAGLSGQVLSTDGFGVLSWITSGGGGLVNFTEALSTFAPNNLGVPIASLTATNAATNVDVAISPKGQGALTAQIADNTSIGGNKRGAQSVDWQMRRSANINVASGFTSTIGGGENNTASGDNSTVSGGNGNTASFSSAGNSTVGGGSGNTASGDNSVIAGGSSGTASGDYSTISGGNQNTASGLSGYASVGGGYRNSATGTASSIPGGLQAVASNYGQMAQASGAFSADGDAQTSVFVVRSQTTNAAATSLFLDGVGMQINVPTNGAMNFKVRIVGKTAGSPATVGAWEISGVIYNNGGIATIVGANVTTTYNAAGWGVPTVTGNLSKMDIKVTGAIGTTINWVARVETTEVIF